MKTVLELKTLRSAIDVVKTTVASKAAMEVFRFLCFRNDKLMTYDGVSGTITKCEMNGLEFCIDMQEFSKVLRSLAEENLELELASDASRLKLRSGSFKCSLPAIPHFDFPNIFPTDVEKLCDAPNLKEAVRAVFWAAGDDSVNAVLQGIALAGSYCYSSDGKRATRSRLSSPTSKQVTISRQTAKQIERLGTPSYLFASEGTIGALYVEQKTILTSRTLEANFPVSAVDSFFDKPRDNTVELPEDLSSVISRVARGKDAVVRVFSSNGHLEVTSKDENSEAREVLDWSCPHEVAFRVRAPRLLAALKKSHRVDLSDLVTGDARMLLFLGDSWEHALALYGD